MATSVDTRKIVMVCTVGAILSILTSTCMGRNILLNREWLYAGQSLEEGPYRFIMQDDCNLVLYEYSTPVWASNTGVTGRNGCRAVMQADGNFVVYDANSRAVWASKSRRGNGNYILVLQEDRNVVIYGSDIWSTGTYRKKVGGTVVMAMNGTVDGSTVIGPVIVNQNVTPVENVTAAAS
uniref:Agglutinin preproprotein n=1 Tax=Allium senescens TaxID=70766 RepID=A0A191QKD3_9ASPA|nr:agglutinin preproprotein [Allium senescens]